MIPRKVTHWQSNFSYAAQPMYASSDLADENGVESLIVYCMASLLRLLAMVQISGSCAGNIYVDAYPLATRLITATAFNRPPSSYWMVTTSGCY